MGNSLSMSGLRVLSAPCDDALKAAAPWMAPGARNALGLLCANVVVCSLSTPLHQLYQFAITQRVAEKALGDKDPRTSPIEYLKKQSFQPSGGLSRVVMRDAALRVTYGAGIFTLFGGVEKAFVALWPWKN